MLSKKIWKRLSIIDPVDDSEEIIFLIREHVVLITIKAISLILIAFLLIITKSLIQSSIDSSLIYNIFNTAVYSVNLILLTIFTMMFHNYYLSIQIVTSKRIIDIDQTGLFKREVNELYFNEIQNITYKQNGMLALLFNFGDVIVETAGEQSKVETSGFVFDSVANPQKVSEKISEVFHQHRIKEDLKDK